ncbi:GroES-like protein [Dacryopinax primogenitus]|uniref:GroES-like protein n=1 Tax=Dacryopinax primogenitus (strain DJM 731) TaxID=1858805 RepID=M5G4H0_DACPD|nr:GroES-like protein [Dacryopinax primogenitus]EJT98637.1 GroES-like protein [Dacryopinax primogenitus]
MALPFQALSLTSHKQTTPLTLLPFTEPELGTGELLIQNVAVAQNPVDWKQIDFDFNIPSLPFVPGADIAGVVYKVGPSVEGFKGGDRVISWLTRKTARHGGYQTYSIASHGRTFHLPECYSFEQGCTITAAFASAGAGLEHGLGVELPITPAKWPAESDGEPLLVWGGSSSVGAFVIQTAKAAGYTVFSTASPKNHAYVKSLGATEVFDYHDPDVVSKIRASVGPNLSKIFDSISENGSIEASVASITAPSGIVAVILAPKAEQSTATVRVVQTGALKTSEPEIGQRVFGLLNALLQNGSLVPNPIKIMPGGLLGVNEGLQLGREHRISGEKLVYVVADTKF